MVGRRVNTHHGVIVQAEKAGWSEENAGLKGKVTALEAQLEAITAAEANAKEGAAQAAVLARELANANAERERLNQQLRNVKEELDRYGVASSQ